MNECKISIQNAQGEPRAERGGHLVFAARNAIDGIVCPESHGEYPYQSWGINRDPQACWTLEFGHPVKAEALVLTTRADFPTMRGGSVSR